MTEQPTSIRSRIGLRRFVLRGLPRFLLLCVLALAIAAVASGCSSGAPAPSSASREAALRQIATEYAASGDLQQAQAALEKLGLANPGQLLVSLAESDMAAGKAREEVEATARLAEMLGARSQKLVAYLSPTAAPPPPATRPPDEPTDEPPVPTVAPTVLAATIEPAPTETVAPAPTETAVPPTETTAPPTSSPTPEPQNPRVVADGSVNLRGGPGKAYPVVGRLPGGQEAAIVGRNDSGDWWQVEYAGAKQAWVAGTVIRVLGAIDTVPVAKNIPPVPTAPPKPTAAPQPTAAPAAQPPAASGPAFKLVTRRLWTVEETGGFLAGTSVNCGYQHNLHVYVKDAAGNLLNGVTIREVGGAQQELVSGSKAPGMAEFDLFPPGKDVFVIRDVDGREATSDTGAAPTNPAAIPFDILRGSRYCTDDADCAHFLSQNGCYGHFSWDFVYQRNY